MSGSVNKVVLLGNLGRDPEVRSTQDGMKIVDLGCGWGSLTLWLCEKVSKKGDVVVDPFLFGEKFSSNYIIELFRFVHSTLMLRLQVFPTVILSVNSS